MPHDPRKGILFALAAAFGIAAFVVPWKIASSHGPSHTNTLILLTAAALFNTLLSGFAQRQLPRFRGFDLGFAVVLAFLTLAGNLTSARAIQELSPAVLTVVQRSEVILVALMAWPLLGERIDRRFWIGATIAGCGLVLLQTPFDPRGVAANGMTWAALSAICFSAMAVLTRKYVRRLDLVAVNALRLWLSVGLWFALYGFPRELGEMTGAQIFYASLAAFFGPFFGRLCMMHAARSLEARIITLVTLASPPITLALAFLVLGDLPTTREMQGGALMLVGIAVPILAWTNGRR